MFGEWDTYDLELHTPKEIATSRTVLLWKEKEAEK